MVREGRAVKDGEAAAHIVASTGSRGSWSAAARSRAILERFGVNIDDAANGISLGHPRPHNLTHRRAFHEMVEGRLNGVVDGMREAGRGWRATRGGLRDELRKIGREILDQVEIQ
jgi:hypothetical protein